MNKKVLFIHRILLILNIAALAGTLVFYLFKWSSLPEEIGIHFDSKGNFDVTAAKIYGFYPHLIGSVLLAIDAMGVHFINKKKTGFNITEKAESIVKILMSFCIDLFFTFWNVEFVVWSLLVAFQKPKNGHAIACVEAVVPIVMIIVIGVQNFICIKYRTKKRSVDPNVRHRLSDLVSWLITLGSVLVLMVVWDRLPSDPKYYFDPEYNGLAYFKNLNTFMDKRLLLIPQALVIVILALLEVFTAKAKRSGKEPMVSLLDKLKIITACFFFWWNTVLQIEEAVGLVSVGIFTALVIASVMLYRRDKKKA